jgi:hypothetical protein
MKFDGPFIFLFLSHPKTMNYEGLLNFLHVSNSKTNEFKWSSPLFASIKF